jgi:hypothetical protein
MHLNHFLRFTNCFRENSAKVGTDDLPVSVV